MALQLSLSSPPPPFHSSSTSQAPIVSCSLNVPISVSTTSPRRRRARPVWKKGPGRGGFGPSGAAVRSSLETVEPTVGQVTEACKDTFWPLVKAAGSKIVVVDMYTQWCGPCKVMAPKFQKLSETYLDVVFLKLDCNQENRPLAKELVLKVVPTFKILKDGKVVKEVRGAKYDDLVLAIDTLK
ncbi:thioredoxin F2, chloroplastic-like [Iris pallida]|uniref:Thioredoxin F2, chloroplastic-like n=1 Tax=Iris pallida TaxID=29817 RepID=A0AAX6E1U9_IRIPA|nr:thioredoxin F2, chloroplastic-like [Iris pallida]